MKSLYAILRIHPKVSAEEIDSAYERLVGQLTSSGQPVGEETRAQLVAVREAHHVLSDPVTRQMYDQKLAMDIGGLKPQRPASLVAEYAEPRHSLPLLKILLGGAMAIGALTLYTNHIKEQERLRLEAVQAVAEKSLALEREKQQLAEAEQAARLERQQRMDDAAVEAKSRYEAQQALREANYRSQQMAREEESRRRMEEQRQEAVRRQELRDAQIQAARDIQKAQQLDRESARMRF